MRVKICPNCSLYNHEKADTCTGCPASLDGAEEIEISPPPGEKITDSMAKVAAESDPQSDATALFIRLRSPEGTCWKIEDGFVVGRGADVDLREVDPTSQTSRNHIKFELKEGKWLFKNLSKNSPTRLGNSLPMKLDQEYMVKHGDVLTLGDLVELELILKDSN